MILSFEQTVLYVADMLFFSLTHYRYFIKSNGFFVRVCQMELFPLKIQKFCVCIHLQRVFLIMFGFSCPQVYPFVVFTSLIRNVPRSVRVFPCLLPYNCQRVYFYEYFRRCTKPARELLEFDRIKIIPLQSCVSDIGQGKPKSLIICMNSTYT